MRWIYGKQDWNTLKRGLENNYLLTNGLGGFSALTVTGAASRNDHSVFMACMKAPNHRYNMVHRFFECLFLGDEEKILSTQEFADGHIEDGYRYLSSFIYEDTPLWRYHVNGVSISKEIAMKYGENTVAICYTIENRGKCKVSFELTPFFQFAKKGEDMKPSQTLVKKGNQILSDGMALFFETNGKVTDTEEKEEVYFYSYDVCDGRRETGHGKANHVISVSAQPGEKVKLKLVYSMEQKYLTEEKWQDAEEIIKEYKERRQALVKTAGLSMTMAQELVKSADQFVSRRESTNGSTILAGYPFFEDWGRDTMIALPGICISTGQYDTAKEILRTFALNENKGLMPNLFPEGGNEPLYNTVDAALLFINCIYLYYEKTEDLEFVKEMYPVMERIVKGYKEGTDFGIHMDTDGLIQAGEGLWQVTWMDVRVGEILPTPRHGKPVEINAYWYNALCIMEKFARILNREWQETGLKEQVKKSFLQKFWMEKRDCLKDLVSGTAADEQVRCNQIWAVSMPFTMLIKEQEKAVVETVFETLYTPYGLRTLEMSDKEFKPVYQGKMEERDMAYHQGTVWTFPLGAYYLAYLKVKDYNKEAKETVKEQLEVMESAMREGCVGQLPEIYDGENPTRSKGCFAQAWSVGEILRVYEAVEKCGDKE